jgi:hypothetical protein
MGSRFRLRFIIIRIFHLQGWLFPSGHVPAFLAQPSLERTGRFLLFSHHWQTALRALIFIPRELVPAPVAAYSRRTVNQRWTYEPVTQEDAPPLALPKRSSKPPDRLGMGTKSLMMGPSILHKSSPNPSPGERDSSSISPSLGGEGAHPMGATFPSSVQSFPVLRDSSAPPPPHSPRVDGWSMDMDGRFSIRLLFPERRSPTMIFTVATGMPVARLRLLISELVEAVNLVYLLVGGPSWTHDILEHSGTITDRFFPGTLLFPAHTYSKDPASTLPRRARYEVFPSSSSCAHWALIARYWSGC